MGVSTNQNDGHTQTAPTVRARMPGQVEKPAQLAPVGIVGSHCGICGLPINFYSTASFLQATKSACIIKLMMSMSHISILVLCTATLAFLVLAAVLDRWLMSKFHISILLFQLVRPPFTRVILIGSHNIIANREEWLRENNHAFLIKVLYGKGSTVFCFLKSFLSPQSTWTCRDSSGGACRCSRQQ